MLVEEFTAERTRGQAVARAFAFLDPAQVAERAGVARSAFYHHWGEAPDGEADGLLPFQRFVGELFETDWGDAYSPEILTLAAGHRGTLSDFVREGIETEWRRYEDPLGWAAWRSGVALAAYGGSRESNMEAIYGEMAELYTVLLARFGRRMRPPLTTKDLTVTIAANLDGLLFRRTYGSQDANRSVPWRNPETGEPERWTLLSIAVNAVVGAMTEPDE